MPVPQPAASVVICTRNRAASLSRTLASLVDAGARIAQPWEVVVVDNGSSDDTPQAIAAFADRLPIRAVSEPRAGLSNARNAGLLAAQGKYVIWTDDDVRVDPDWLAAYLRAFANHPDTVIFGGRATPCYEEPVTSWFAGAEPALGSLLAIRDHRDWDEITPDRLPYGLNYAVRAAEQRETLYDPALGVAPGRRNGGEETDVICRLLARGATGIWVWDAAVQHMIPAERQTLRYIFEYYRSAGQDWPVIASNAGRVCIGGVPLRLLAMMAKRIATASIRRLTGSPRWINSYVDLARMIGNVERFRKTRDLLAPTSR